MTNGSRNHANAALMKVIRFSLDDLANNRNGRLTVNQGRVMREDMTAYLRNGKRIALFSWTTFAVLAFLAIGVGLPDGLASRGGKAGGGFQVIWLLIGFGGVALLSALFASFLVFLGRAGERNLNGGLPVRSVTGIAAKQYYSDEFGAVLKIGDCEFIFPDAEDPVYEVFDAGSEYTAFYVFNTTNMIVSAEMRSTNL